MSLARDVTTVGGATLASRLLGFARDMGVVEGAERFAHVGASQASGGSDALQFPAVLSGPRGSGRPIQPHPFERGLSRRDSRPPLSRG